MRTEVLKACNVDEAVDQILNELREDSAGSARSSGRNNVIYFDGWDGLGASAVLRAVGRRLTPAASQEKELTAPTGQRAPDGPTGLEFSHIFHIDCSKWESRRAMQRMIAEQLKLPDSVMEMFDAQDVEDAYLGIGKDSRSEIPKVAKVINQHIEKLNQFLLIFNNGSSEEIDLESIGFPVFNRYSRNKMLWSFQGRFRVCPRTKVDRFLKNTTDVFLSGDSSDMGEDKLSDILGHEAEEVARKMVNTAGINLSAAATSYFLYMMKLYSMGNHINDYDMSTHVCNYWKCDGMIQLQQQGNVCTDDSIAKLWLYADALHREIQLDEDYYHFLSAPVVRSLHKHMAYWTSPTCGFMLVPVPNRQIPKGMFHQFKNLCVLKLSSCKFSFTAPPFLCCHNLRFLGLDRCQEESSTTEVVKDDIHCFFQRLWVFDVRHSAFLSKEIMDHITQLRELNVVGEDYFLDMNLMQSRLPNICRLRVKDSRIHSNMKVKQILFSGMDKMELLEFSRNQDMYFKHSFSVENSCSSLETITIDGSDHLKEISLRGCSKLKNIFLSGSFPDLYSICITGSAVETLDLSAVMALKLDELCLLDCEKIYAIFWPRSVEVRRKRYLDQLVINNTQHSAGRSPREFDWYISVKDARILQWLESVKDYFGPNHPQVEISSPSHHPCDDAGGKHDRMKITNRQAWQVEQELYNKGNAIYINFDHMVVPSKEILHPPPQSKYKDLHDKEVPIASKAILHPPPPPMPPKGCYIHIEDETRTKLQTASTAIPSFICDSAKILHVHDSLHITSIVEAPDSQIKKSTVEAPLPSTWNQLEWCRVERCPKLQRIFSPQSSGGPEERDEDTDMFMKLREVWASLLPYARYIWKWSGRRSMSNVLIDLASLNLSFCHRLICIIDLPLTETAYLGNLETLQITWCCNLITAFHLYDTPKSSKQFQGWSFPKLKHIHLHELPKLQNICNIGMKMYTPELRTVNIRGCWSLRTLPIVESKNVVWCDCEKEWWDMLEWESAKHANQYTHTHPRYYKKTMLRGSVLR